MAVELIDPTDSSIPYHYTLARRRPILGRPVIGLLDNGKPNAGRILSGVADRMEARLGVTLERVVFRKPHASRVMPADVTDMIVRRCRFALVGVGD